MPLLRNSERKKKLVDLLPKILTTNTKLKMHFNQPLYIQWISLHFSFTSEKKILIVYKKHVCGDYIIKKWTKIDKWFQSMCQSEREKLWKCSLIQWEAVERNWATLTLTDNIKDKKLNERK